MSDHKLEKLKNMYRYSMPLHWILDKLEDGVYDEITGFDIRNAKHSLDELENPLPIPRESNN